VAVTIEKRPIGVILDDCISASINQDYSSIYATVSNYSPHGLSDGDYVYIQSNVENYNGFFQIEVISSTDFILVQDPFVEWIVDADITYCPQRNTHGWSCIHLPIVYELSNTKYPTNSVDTARTISSIESDNGLVNLNLSGSLGTFEDLAFIKISNCADSDFDGIYQVLDKLSNSDVTINLTYTETPASAITGATVQLYYSNYNIVVNVYAGINSGHTWASEKPYELAATLELIPDANNKVKFSINEILKSYIELSNNLLQPSLPNNIDAWTQFYITVAEQYDTSNGYTITTFEGAFASDQDTFEGYAANSVLPFKNIHSGYLSDYVSSPDAGQFLTLFTRPRLFTGAYSDVSFIFDLEASNSLQFENKNFTTNLDGWVSFAGSDRASEQPWVWDLFDGIGRTGEGAIADATGLNVNLTQYLAQARVGGWPIGTYQMKIVSANDSTTGFFTVVRVFGMNNGTSQTEQTIVATPVSAKFETGIVTTKYVTFTTTQVWNYLAVAFDNVLDDIVQSITLLKINYYTSDEPGVDEIILRKQFYNNNVVALTTSEPVTFSDSGIYRIELEADCDYDRLDVSIYNTTNDKIISTKTFDIDCDCSNQSINLSWLNYLGGFDYHLFTAESEHAIDITNSGETKQNIFPSWPNSYGEHADTIRKQTFRDSNTRIFVNSQYLTQDQADAIAYIKTSPLVQIVNSRQDRRTVIVDSDSFVKYKDGDKTYSISFNISYTNDIPSQRV